MEAKIQKLEEQFSSDAALNPFKRSNLFAGISILVNGLTNPSADELKRIMKAHGGVYNLYQRSTTTFIIAENLPDVKIRQITSAKIISPKWVVDCLKENRILDYSPYLLYTNHKTDQPKLAFKKDTKRANETIDESKYNNQPPKAVHSNEEEIYNIFEELNIFNQKIRESEQFGIGNESSVQDPQKQNVARTAVDPNFLSEFYNNSRLHHIATLGAMFKDYISELREKLDQTTTFPARQELIEKFNTKPNSNISGAGGDGKVMHIDMDCFFVSVGLRTRPHLRGIPVAVTHSKGSNTIPVRAGADPQREREMYAARLNEKLIENVMGTKSAKLSIDATDSLSEIASCSYEARQKGLKNGMFVGSALKLCPNLKTIPYDFKGYQEVARTLYNTLAK